MMVRVCPGTGFTICQRSIRMIHIAGHTIKSFSTGLELGMGHSRLCAFLCRSDDSVAVPDERQSTMLVELLGRARRVLDALHDQGFEIVPVWRFEVDHF